MIFYILFSLIRNLFRIPFAPLLFFRRRRACPKTAWVHLEIDGDVREMPRPRRFLPWQKEPHSVSLYRVRALVDALLEDPAPAGLLVTVKGISTSAAHRTALHTELARLRARGRPVVVHLPSGGASSELLIAAGASRVLISKRTTLGPLGFQWTAMYGRQAIARVGLIPDIHAQGAYKTAGEGFVRDAMSEPQREQFGRILDGLHDELVSALAEGRKVPLATAAAWLDKGLLGADEAVDEHVADEAIYDDEVLLFLGADAKRTPNPARLIPAARYLARRQTRVFRPFLPRRRIAILEMHGPIVERVPVAGSVVADAEHLITALQIAAEDSRVAGVIVHMDSPGGGVVASDKIHRAVVRLAEVKPVVACFGGVSASGGYYVAAACQSIVAQPTTLTGSIGVVAARVIIGPLLARLGIRADVLTRGAHADMLSPLRPFGPKEQKVFEQELERTYRDFIALVAIGRRRNPDEIYPLAGGRVWTGHDAHERGLVDQLGGLDVAIQEVKARLAPKVREKTEVMLMAPRTRNPWDSLPLPFRLLPGARLNQTLDRYGLKPLLDTLSLLMSSRESIFAVWLPWE